MPFQAAPTVGPLLPDSGERPRGGVRPPHLRREIDALDKAIMRQFIPSAAAANLAPDKMQIFQRINCDVRQTLRIVLSPEYGAARSRWSNQRPLEPESDPRLWHVRLLGRLLNAPFIEVQQRLAGIGGCQIIHTDHVIVLPLIPEVLATAPVR